ncbi:hypothetical protein E4U56_004349 [Claviceps arundinis]|uniref:Uncharacterized protein n=1 Tax=Claviceps arundinis TaxID=1623583 RepID=A0A9P7SLQ3_9HYPO|nr:hypothetical protein E4U56_004349 [Claviceps arundinis]
MAAGPPTTWVLAAPRVAVEQSDSNFQPGPATSVVFPGKEAEFDVAASPNAPLEEGLRRARER